MIISNSLRLILYMSKSYVGRSHDFAILKTELPPEKDWFSNFEVEIDLGYIGFKKRYKCKGVKIPHKKKKNTELNEEQKEENKLVSSTRINVEHSIGGMKRYNILSHRLRMHDYHLYDDIAGVCAGLWNFNVIYPSD